MQLIRPPSLFLLAVLAHFLLLLPYLYLFLLPGLSHWFLLSLCLVSVVRLPCSSMAAPARPSSRPPSPAPQWACPCGDGQDQDLDNEYGLVTGSLTDRELLRHIILQARISLDEANRFKYNYVSSSLVSGRF